MNELPPHVYAVVLAGGSGTRFWPKSRHFLPKQLCKIGSSETTMLEQTLARFDGLIPPSRRLVVTHSDQMALTRQIACNACQHFLAEPFAKNTAHALALAALEIQALADPKEAPPLMISVHADALIKNWESLKIAFQRMIQTAELGHLTLLGITPEYPETGYGYIEKGTDIENMPNGYRVRSFREKPDLVTARKYVEAGHFLWNSGIFAWQIKTVLAEFAQWLPNSLLALQNILRATQSSSFSNLPLAELAKVYGSLPSVAIDDGILEKSRNVAVIEADIGWKDVGSWDALDQCFKTDSQGNLFYGDVIALDSQGLTVDSDAKIVACIGVKDLVVVVANGAVLVCPKNRAQEVKKIVEELKKTGRIELI